MDRIIVDCSEKGCRETPNFLVAATLSGRDVKRRSCDKHLARIVRSLVGGTSSPMSAQVISTR